MKKFGFTLSELVITLAIVGVASAMVAPSIAGLMPDKHKVKVIRYHSMLNNALVTIVNRNGYFQLDQDQGIPANYEANLRADLARELKLNNGRYADGSVWDISDLGANGGDIIIDTEPNSNKGPYSANNNRLGRIDTFIFRIDEAGSVLPGDALTSAYLSNPLKMNDAQNDLRTARQRAGNYN